jgi:hypothetical protein
VSLKIFGNGRAPESRPIVFVFGDLVLVFSPPSTDSCISPLSKPQLYPLRTRPLCKCQCRNHKAVGSPISVSLEFGGEPAVSVSPNNPTSAIRRGQNSQTPRSRGDDEVQSWLCEISRDFDEFQVTSASYCSALHRFLLFSISKMEQLAKISPFETVLEFGRSSSVLSPGTIGVLLLLIIWALFVIHFQVNKIPSH